MNNFSTIVGVRHFIWKDEPATTLFVTTEMDAKDCYGCSTEDLFLKGNWDFKVGQHVNPVYRKGFKGMAILDRVDLVE